MTGDQLDAVPVQLDAVGESVIEQVAWAVHCWTCPLCGSLQEMAASGQGHVTEDDVRFAAFLTGALGLVRPGNDQEGHR